MGWTQKKESITVYELKKQDIVDLILKDGGIDKKEGRTIKVEFKCTGGYDGYSDKDGYSNYTPMDLYEVKITVTDKS